MPATAPDLPAFLQKIHLVKWQAPRRHDRELLVWVRSDEGLEKLLLDLYRLEHGAQPPLEVDFLPFRLPGAAAGKDLLLRLRSMHTYLLLDRWLEDRARILVYYPCWAPLAGQDAAGEEPGEAGGLPAYVRWGYELPELDALALRARLGSGQDLVLLNPIGKLGCLRFPAPQFAPIADLVETFLPATRPPAATALTRPLAGPLFTLPVGLRPAVERGGFALRTQESLQARIDELEFQLEMLRLSGAAGGQAYLCAYEEDPQAHAQGQPDGLDFLRDFIVRRAPAELDRLEYQRLHLELEGRPRIFHLLAAQEADPQRAEREFPPFPAFRFYLEPEWEAAGLKLYLPVEAGSERRMVLSPPLVPRRPGQLGRFLPALLCLPPGASAGPGRWLLWPDPWPGGPLLRLGLDDWLALGQAWGYLNVRGLAERGLGRPERVDVLLEQVTAQAGPALRAALLPARQALEAEWARRKAGLEQEWAARLTDLEARWQRQEKAFAERQAAIEESVRQIGARERKLQARLAALPAQAQQAEALLDQIDALRQADRQDWDEFCARVQALDSAVQAAGAGPARPAVELLAEVRERRSRQEAELRDLRIRLEQALERLGRPLGE